MRLGPDSIPPTDAFPRPLRAAIEAQLLLRDLSERAPSSELEGIGVGSRTATGIARVVSGAEDAIDRIEPGDILVARVTSPAFNVVLPLAAGLVVEHGGLMSHAALVARELDIPAVVGVRDATRNVIDGERILVDPTTGQVVLLDVRRSVEALPSRPTDPAGIAFAQVVWRAMEDDPGAGNRVLAGAQDFTFLATMLGEAAVRVRTSRRRPATRCSLIRAYAILPRGIGRGTATTGSSPEQDGPLGEPGDCTYTEANHGHGFAAEDVPEAGDRRHRVALGAPGYRRRSFVRIPLMAGVAGGHPTPSRECPPP